MSAHNILHLFNPQPILNALTMTIQLLEQLLSVILVDRLKLFDLSFSNFSSVDVPRNNVVGVAEPDWFVVIFKKLASHL